MPRCDPGPVTLVDTTALAVFVKKTESGAVVSRRTQAEDLDVLVLRVRRVLRDLRGQRRGYFFAAVVFAAATPRVTEFATSGSLPSSTTTRAPGCRSPIAAFSLPRITDVFSLSVMVTVLPSFVVTCRWLSCIAATVPITLCTCPL